MLRAPLLRLTKNVQLSKRKSTSSIRPWFGIKIQTCAFITADKTKQCLWIHLMRIRARCLSLPKAVSRPLPALLPRAETMRRTQLRLHNNQPIGSISYLGVLCFVKEQMRDDGRRSRLILSLLAIFFAPRDLLPVKYNIQSHIQISSQSVTSSISRPRNNITQVVCLRFVDLSLTPDILMYSVQG